MYLTPYYIYKLTEKIVSLIVLYFKLNLAFCWPVVKQCNGFNLKKNIIFYFNDITNCMILVYKTNCI